MFSLLAASGAPRLVGIEGLRHVLKKKTAQCGAMGCQEYRGTENSPYTTSVRLDLQLPGT